MRTVAFFLWWFVAGAAFGYFAAMAVEQKKPPPPQRIYIQEPYYPDPQYYSRYTMLWTRC